MPRNSHRRDHSLGEAVTSIVKEAGKSLFRQILRGVAFCAVGGILGAFAGAGASLIYGYPFLTAVVVGAGAGLVIALLILGFLIFLHA